MYEDIDSLPRIDHLYTRYKQYPLNTPLPFGVDDKVVCIFSDCNYKRGSVFTVTEVYDEGGYWRIMTVDGEGKKNGWYAAAFVPLSDPQNHPCGTPRVVESAPEDCSKCRHDPGWVTGLFDNIRVPCSCRSGVIL